MQQLKYGDAWAKCQNCRKLFIIRGRGLPAKQQAYCGTCRMIKKFI